MIFKIALFLLGSISYHISVQGERINRGEILGQCYAECSPEHRGLKVIDCIKECKVRKGVDPETYPEPSYLRESREDPSPYYRQEEEYPHYYDRGQDFGQQYSNSDPFEEDEWLSKFKSLRNPPRSNRPYDDEGNPSYQHDRRGRNPPSSKEEFDEKMKTLRQEHEEKMRKIRDDMEQRMGRNWGEDYPQ